MIAGCLLILDVRVFKALETLAPIEQSNRPITKFIRMFLGLIPPCRNSRILRSPLTRHYAV